MVARYREHYPTHAITGSLPLPGVAESLAAIRRVARADRGRVGEVHAEREAAPGPPRPGRRRAGRRSARCREGHRPAGAQRDDLRRRPHRRHRRGSRCRCCRGERCHWSVHCGRAARLRRGRSTERSDRVPGLARRVCAGAAAGSLDGEAVELPAAWWSRSAAAPTRPSCWRPRPGRSARRTWSRRPLSVRACRWPSWSPRRGSPTASACGTSPRPRTRWTARATRPTRATGATSARPNWSRRCSRSRTSSASTAIATGTNADDAIAGFRPGIRAAFERGAITPLRDARLTKAQIREASRSWGLETSDKPAAACLSSRIAYGIRITPNLLARVDRAEQAVRNHLTPYGVQNVRVRDLGESASIEIDARPARARSTTPRWSNWSAPRASPPPRSIRAASAPAP